MTVLRRAAALVLLLALPCLAEDEPKPDNLDDIPTDAETTRQNDQLLRDMLQSGDKKPPTQEEKNAGKMLDQLKTAPGAAKVDPKTQAALELLIKGGAPSANSGGTSPTSAGSGPVPAGSAYAPPRPAVAGAKPNGTAPTTASAASVQSRGSSAFSKASKMGEELKSGMRSADDAAGLPGGPAGSGAPSGKPGAAQGTSSLSTPADPKNKGDLALAAMTGFKGSFERLGLKERRGEIVGPDGKPATEAELAALAADIKSQPKALTTRPDFFSVVTPEQFGGLKKELKEKPRLKAFKHLEVAEERDVTRSEACEKVSGKCNEFARGASYKKGDFVAPEELRSLAERPREKDEELPEEEPRPEPAPEAPGPERVVLDAAARKPIYARLNSVFNAIKAMLGGDAQAGSAAAAVSSGGASQPAAASWEPGTGASAAPVELQESPKAKTAAAPPKPSGAASAAASTLAAPGALPPAVWGLAGLGLLVVIVAVSRRRDDE